MCSRYAKLATGRNAGVVAARAGCRRGGGGGRPLSEGNVVTLGIWQGRRGGG